MAIKFHDKNGKALPMNTFIATDKQITDGLNSLVANGRLAITSAQIDAAVDKKISELSESLKASLLTVRSQPISAETLQALINTGKSYCDHVDQFIYGHNTAWRHYSATSPAAETPLQIDCSSFVMMLLSGVPFEMSRYNAGREENAWGYSGYGYSLYNSDTEYQNDRYSTSYAIAKELMNRGLCYVPNGSNLQPGDVLFYGDTSVDEYKNRFLGIYHTEIFIGWCNASKTAYMTLDCSNNTTPLIAFRKRMVSSTLYAKLVLCARVPMHTPYAENDCEYRVNLSYRTTGKMSCFLPKSRMYTMEFDAIAVAENTHFTLSLNSAANTTTPDVVGSAVGKLLHYKLLFNSDEVDITSFQISAVPSSDGTLIRNVHIYEGVLPRETLFSIPASKSELQDFILVHSIYKGANHSFRKECTVDLRNCADLEYYKGVYFVTINSTAANIYAEFICTLLTQKYIFRASFDGTTWRYASDSAS